MAGKNRPTAAATASARSHTRARNSSKNTPCCLLRGVCKNLLVVVVSCLLAFAYQAIRPAPPKICGTPGGPPVTSPRIKLRDGRYLAYEEHGVPKSEAKSKIVFIHGFDCSKEDVIPISPETYEELGIYMVSFDRSGYGESDPNPKRTERSIALDVEQLADQLQLGEKIYVIGFSMGGELTWTCLGYIPHRLAGAALLAPVTNFWWRGFPPNVSRAAFDLQHPQDRWAVRVAHYAPWLTYWWNTQKWFPSSGVIAMESHVFNPQDMPILQEQTARIQQSVARQQGEYESLHRDMIVHFGRWELSPLDFKTPLPNVHLWHGADDRMVPVISSRYIAQQLPWIHYHELPEAGHLFPLQDSTVGDRIVRSLLLGD